ncbi:MAG TPA: hypothetical protein VHH35_02715, partial [Pyrinomonadaceae bacterium]|nr:hypothetical protein [Pyrinomonadaceae bacterium]
MEQSSNQGQSPRSYLAERRGKPRRTSGGIADAKRLIADAKRLFRQIFAKSVELKMLLVILVT